jgi:hypothetical protein
MKEIHVEGMKYFYCFKSDGLPSKNIEEMLIRDNPLLHDAWDSVLQADFDDMRLILLASLFQPKILHPYFLHWDDDTNLDILDSKVASDTHTDADFHNAVISRFGKTFCTNCDWQGYTPVLFTAESYINQPELERTKIDLRQGSFKHCPNCNVRLRQMVTKIF